MSSRVSRFVVLGALLCATSLKAQRNDGNEFTRQGLLIVNFMPGVGADHRLGREAGNAVRSRLGRFLRGRDVEIIDGNSIEAKVLRGGFNPDSTFSRGEVHTISRLLRADEYVIGEVSATPRGMRLSGELVLFRDRRLRQPLPAVIAPRLDSAALLFAGAIAAARTQLEPQRRCENALRGDNRERAIAAAREGVALYPRSTLARTCLVWALRMPVSSAAEVLAAAREVLAIDSVSPHALDAAAVSLDSLRRRDEAATMWLRLAETDTSDIELGLRVSYALLFGGNARRAEPFITRLAAAHPEDMRVVQQKWRIGFESRSWTTAIDAGEVLLARDSSVTSDSSFYLRLGTAYHVMKRPYKAIEMLAHGVAAFPHDAQLYALYAQYVRAESDTVVQRGLALFPKSADLLVLGAQEYRAKGQLDQSLDATRRAVELDSTMLQAQVQVAQLEFELGRPDSGLVALSRAVQRGADSTIVAQVALARGNAIYRAANSTKKAADFGLAYRLLSFADSVRPSSQAKFLAGISAMGFAQASFSEAATLKEKDKSCELAVAGGAMVPIARAGIEAGQDAFAEAAAQAIAFVSQLEAYMKQQTPVFCAKTP